MVIMNWMRNNKKLAVVGVLITGFSLFMEAMDNTPNSDKTNKWCIYEDGTDKKIEVSENVVALSATMKALLDDLGELGERAISLPFSQDVIRNVFSLLTKSLQKNGLQHIEMTIEDYTLSSLVPIANCLDYLACPADIENIVLSHIRQMIDSQNIINNNDLVALNPDLQKLIMGDPAVDYLKKIIITKEIGNRKKILPSRSAVNSVTFGPDNKEIITGGDWGEHTSNSLIWWNGVTGDKLKVLPIFQKIQSIAISPDGTKILVGCNEEDDADQNSLTIWDRVTAKQMTVFPINQSVRAVAWNPDGTKVVSGGDFGAVVWDTQTGDKLIDLPIDKPVLAVAWSFDGTKIACGCDSQENNLIVFEIQDNKVIQKHNLSGDSAAVLAVAWNQNGTMLASGGAENEKKLKIWDFSNIKPVEIESLGGHPRAILAIAWSHDGKRMASGCEGHEKNIILWNFDDNGTLTHQYLTGIRNSVNAVAFNKSSTLLVAGGNHGSAMHNNSLIVWTLLTEEEQAALNEIRNCNSEHIRLIYQLCLTHVLGTEIRFTQESPELPLLATLPKNIKTLLKKYVLSR